MFVASDCELIPGMALLLCFFFTNKILKKVCWLKKKFMACINPKGHVLGSNKFLHPQFSSVQFSHSVMSDSSRPHGLKHTRLPCPSPTPRACSNSSPSSQWCYPTISSSVVPFSPCPFIQFSSVLLRLTLCYPIDCSSPGFPVHHQLLELAQAHVHRVGDAIRPSHLLLFLPLVFPSIRVFSNESVLHIRWPKYWSFSISLSNEYSGLISFRMDWFDLLAVQGTLRSLL